MALHSFGMFLASDIQENKLERVGKCLPAFEDREEAHSKQRAENPENPDNNPSSEETLAENIASAVHRHRPKYKKCEPENGS